MLKTIKIRLYPTKEQANMLNQHFGSCRFVYNQGLNTKLTAYQTNKTKLSKFDLVNQLPTLKSQYQWLNDIKAECLQSTFDDLDSAFKGFFKGKGFPKYKKKSSKNSFKQKQNFKVLPNTNRIVFLKKKIKFKCSVRDQQILRASKIKLITYSKDIIGHFYASVLIDSPETLAINETDNSIGIDLGLKHFAITSDGEFIENPSFYKKSQKKLAAAQRAHSKKQKGSANREKSRLRIAKLHNKIKNKRNHFLHCLSKKLVNENQVICLETLNVKGMMANRKLSKAIADVGWSSFVSKLEYKAKWYGREIKKVSRWYPTSKTCSCCGWKDSNQHLSDRTFICGNVECGYVGDRDLNAATNILNVGTNQPDLKPVEITSLDGSVKQEKKHK